MALSAEHQFIAEEINSVLINYSKTKILGVLEAERKEFDYACVLERDCNRPLVSQVLWSHSEGVHKDLMTMLHNKDATLKVYLARDTTKHRLKIDEVISAYRSQETTRPLLRGLRIIFLPSEFDADSLEEQRLMSNYLSRLVSEDLLFGSIFGRLSKFDVRVFRNHGGPLGLKYLVLDEITKNGLIHNPSFKKEIGYGTDGPLREVTTMLAALGLVRRVDQSIVLVPTLKGRMFMDLTRRLMYEQKGPENSSDELDSIKAALFPSSDGAKYDYLDEILYSAQMCKVQFGRDLLQDINFSDPVFYSQYDWRELYEQLKGMPDFRKDMFSEPDCDYIV